MAGEEMAADQAHIRRLADRLYHGITDQLQVTAISVKGRKVPLGGQRVPCALAFVQWRVLYCSVLIAAA